MRAQTTNTKSQCNSLSVCIALLREWLTILCISPNLHTSLLRSVWFVLPPLCRGFSSAVFAHPKLKQSDPIPLPSSLRCNRDAPQMDQWKSALWIDKLKVQIGNLSAKEFLQLFILLTSNASEFLLFDLFLRFSQL